MISYTQPLSKLEKIELYGLSMHARDLKQNLVFVDYQQAENACEQLAQLLKQQFSTSELASFTFMPIPRGGFIVLGMLAYALDLKPEQLVTDLTSTNKPLVIIDDCALTGFRFREYLKKCSAEQIIFAHLFSAKPLRRSILAQEERVTHCMAAHDLAERPLVPSATKPLGSHYYWAGNSELVAFAWSEPSLLTSLHTNNQTTGRWHLISPHHCLNNRVALGVPLPQTTSATIEVPNTLLYHWQDGILLLANSTSGEMYKLQGSAAAMWRALAVSGDLAQAVNWLSAEYDLDGISVEVFLETAVAANLLTRKEPKSIHAIK